MREISARNSLIKSFSMTILLILSMGISVPNQGFAQTNNDPSQADNNNNNSSDTNPLQQQNTSTNNTTVVTIAKGAANPEVDLTLKKVGNWYIPKKASVSVGDTVTWKNEDTDAHTVTSGLGAGIQSVQTNEKGKPDGLFDSAIVKPGQSWSHTFYNPGTYNYFCTIHPWMEAVIVVVNTVKNSQQIPNYPVDASGNRQAAFPIYVFSKDNKYEVGLKWDPVPILTGKTVTFMAEFFDVKTNTLIQLAPYDFVIIQNGKELDRVHGLTQVGSGIHKYVFSKAGPITVRIENIGDDKNAFGEFTTIVYHNPNMAAAAANAANGTGAGRDITRVSGGTEPVSRILNPLTLVWITYGVIIGLPIAAGAAIFLYKKGII